MILIHGTRNQIPHPMNRFNQTISEEGGIVKEVCYSAGMHFQSAATLFLDGHGVQYDVFIHRNPPESLEEAARERGQKPNQVIRSILFRVNPSTFVMVLIAGPRQVSWKRVRAHLGVTRLSMASEDEVRQNTGYETGAVNPLGLPHPMRILADNNVFNHDQVSIGSGVRGTAILLKPTELKQVIENLETGDFS
jgi:Cys-tRNA(Pro)/Cys-tRNA(Cys) deacylase